MTPGFVKEFSTFFKVFKICLARPIFKKPRKTNGKPVFFRRFSQFQILYESSNIMLQKLIFRWIWGGFLEVFIANLMKNIKKSSPETFGIPKKPVEMGRIGWNGCTSGQCGLNGGSVEVQ